MIFLLLSIISSFVPLLHSLAAQDHRVAVPICITHTHTRERDRRRQKDESPPPRPFLTFQTHAPDGTTAARDGADFDGDARDGDQTVPSQSEFPSDDARTSSPSSQRPSLPRPRVDVDTDDVVVAFSDDPTQGPFHLELLLFFFFFVAAAAATTAAAAGTTAAARIAAGLRAGTAAA